MELSPPPQGGEILNDTTSHIVSSTSYGKVIYYIRENGAQSVQCGAHLEYPPKSRVRQFPVRPV